MKVPCVVVACSAILLPSCGPEKNPAPTEPSRIPEAKSNFWKPSRRGPVLTETPQGQAGGAQRDPAATTGEASSGSPNPTREEKDGGWHANPQSPEGPRIANFVINSLIQEKKLPQAAALQKLTDFQSQVVSGTKFRLTFVLSSGQTVAAQVYEDLRGNLQLNSSEVR